MKGFQRIAMLFGRSASEWEGSRGSRRRSLGERQANYIVLASQVEEAIAADPVLRSAQIDVEVFSRVVQLSGFVDAPADMSRAVVLASEVKGVESVRNCMQLAWW